MQDERTMKDGPSGTPWGFLLAVFFVLTIITTLVPVVSWVQRPTGSAYTGYSYESVGDIFVYLNLIEQAKQGAALFENFFTPEPHSPMLFQPLFFVLGHLARWVHMSSLVIWHVARVGLLAPLLWVIWKCAERLFRAERAKKLAVLFAVGSGAVVSSTSEGSSFLMILYSPKAVMTLWFTLLFFSIFLTMYERRATVLRVSGMFFLSFLQAFLQPYVLLLWAAVPGVFLFVDVLLGLFRWRTLVLVLVGVVAPVGFSLIALGAMVLRHPLLESWSRNAYGLPYPWHVYLLLFGILLPLALFGVLRRQERFFLNTSARFFLLFFITTLALSLSPYPYSYRLVGYLHLPIAFFASAGALAAWELTRTRPAWRVLLLSLLALTLSDNIRHVAVNVTGKYLQSENRFLSAEDSAAVQWLREKTPEKSRILSSPAWDTLLAQQAYRHVYTTSGWQTTDVVHRIMESLAIYRGEYTPVELDVFLRNNDIHYLVVSSRERIKGHWRSFSGSDMIYDLVSFYGFRPEEYPFLHEVYASATFLIYRYQPTR